MTITFEPIWIAVILNALLVITMFISIVNDSGWFAGLFQVIIGIIGTLLIWLIYFATIFFTLK
jgi:hypothetical protein